MILNYRAKRNGRGEYRNDFSIISRRGGAGGGATVLAAASTAARLFSRIVGRIFWRNVGRG